MLRVWMHAAAAWTVAVAVTPQTAAAACRQALPWSAGLRLVWGWHTTGALRTLMSRLTTSSPRVLEAVTRQKLTSRHSSRRSTVRQQDGVAVEQSMNHCISYNKNPRP